MRLSLLTLLVAAALAPFASAQRIEPDILFTNFDDGPGFFSFGGDASGVDNLAAIGEYSSNALRGSVTPSGGTAGFVVNQSAVEASGAESFVFLVRSTVDTTNASGGRDIVVLEVKLQREGGAEFTAFQELAPATGYQFVSIPLSAFRNGGSGLDGSTFTGVIFALGGVTGPDFTIDFENLGFATSPVAVFNDFDDGDFTNDNLITATPTGEGISRSADGPGADGTRNAVIVDYNGATAGDFAVVQFGTPGGGVVDASDTPFFEFMYRDEDDGTVVNIILIESNGEPNGGDVFSATVPLPAGDGYQHITLLLSSFSDNTEGNGELDQLQTVKIEIGERGSGRSTLGIDQVTFRARLEPATQTLADGRGYRLLSAPVPAFTVGDLAGQNLVQGVVGSYPTADDNVFISYEGGSETDQEVYTPAASTDDVLEPGAGFFWFLFDQAIDAPGASDSFPTPFTLFGQGDATTTDVTVSRTLNSDGFYMIGNPFDQPFRLSGVSVSDGSLQTSFFAYDPNAGDTGSYVTRTDADTSAVWQGLFTQVTGGTANPTFTYSASARVSPAAPPFYGRRAEPAVVAFDLRVTDGQAELADLAATIRFEADADTGWDRHDMSKLVPPTARRALVAFEGTDPDGADGQQAVLSLPTAVGTPVEVPLMVSATLDGPFTLSWSGTVPDGLTAELIDRATGDRYSLAEPGRFDGTVANGASRSALAVHVAAANATPTDPEAADGDWIGGPQPNPSVGAVVVPIRLASAQQVRAVVYDVLGRQVAVVADGDLPAGDSVVRADVSGLAPGVYVLRIEGASFATSRRLTVAR